METKTFSLQRKEQVILEMKERVAMQLRNIFDILHRDEDCEMYPNEDEDLVVEIGDIDSTHHYFQTEVEDDYNDVTCLEPRTITEIHLTLDGSVFVYTEEDEDDEYDLTCELSLDDIFGIAHLLDKAYLKLVKSTK